MKKEYTIDVDKWACGSLPKHGSSELLNSQGCMCCLGQVALQSGYTKEKIRGLSVPIEAAKSITKLKFLVETRKDFNGRIFRSDLSGKPLSFHTNFANEAMEINDEGCYTEGQEEINFTLATRVAALRTLFAKHDITLRFKNIKKHLPPKK